MISGITIIIFLFLGLNITFWISDKLDEIIILKFIANIVFWFLWLSVLFLLLYSMTYLSV